MRTHIVVAGVTCALLAMSAQPARAQAADVITEAREVSYSDLNLESEAGAATMLNRLQRAAERVCGYDRRNHWLARREALACAREAMSNAIEAIQSPAVSAQYASVGYGRWDRGGVVTPAPRTVQVAEQTAPPLVSHVADETQATTQTRTVRRARPPQRVFRASTDQSTVRVSYADLDSESAAGRDELEHRLRRAARFVCADNGDGRYWNREYRECVGQARTTARTQMAAILNQYQQAEVDQAPQTIVAAVAAESALPAQSGEPRPLATSVEAAARTPTQAVAQADTGHGICAAREYGATFANRSALLGRDARQEIGYAVDSASVCALETAVIAANANDPLARRRASALRAALIARGVPAEKIVVEHTDDTSALGARVRMNFSGVAHSGAQAEVAPAGV